MQKTQLKSNKKKAFLGILFLIAASMQLTAQNDVYFELGTGFSSGLQTQREVKNSTTVTGPLVVQNQELIKFGLGRGISNKFVFGINKPKKVVFTDNSKFVYGGMGYEFELAQLIGAKTKGESTNNTSGAISSSYSEQSLNSLFFSPKLVFYTVRKGLKDNKKIGFGIGPCVPFLTSANTFYYNKSSGGSVQERMIERKYYQNIGLTASLKLWRYGNKSYFFTEAFFRQNNMFVKSDITTSYKINGNEQVGSMSRANKETQYSNKKEYNSSIPVDPNAPTQGLTVNIPLSSLGMRIGIGILLQSISDEEKERRREIKRKYKDELKNGGGSASTPEETTGSSVDLGIDKTKFKSEILVVLNALKNKSLGSIVDYKSPTDYTNSWYKSSVELNGFSNLKGQNLLGNYSFMANLKNSNTNDNKSYFLSLVKLIDNLGLGYRKEKNSYGDYYYYNPSDKNLYFKVEYNGAGNYVQLSFSRY